MRNFIISALVLVFLFYFAPGYMDHPAMAAFNKGAHRGAPGPGGLIPRRILSSGDRLRSGQTISAPGGEFWLACQKDGNLVLYRQGQPLWSSGTGGKAVRSCVMQKDGNLVLYGYSDEVIWASNTQGNPGAYLAVQDDGNVVIYIPECPIWSTGTNR